MTSLIGPRQITLTLIQRNEKQMQVCFMRDAPDPPQYTIAINDTLLDVVNEIKLLGVWVQNDLK